ncbi:glycosyltransferase family 2 protein [bacterium]|nr:glycosyltransferase family 2 protein [bacterium]
MRDGEGVSVIIPTCDRPLLLRRALASVCAQTRPPTEIIVVDDGRAAAAPRALDDPAVRVVRNDHARGASGARNCGAARARGPLLAFLDDDDDWLPTYLASALARIAADGLDVLCTDILYVDDEDGSERPGKAAPAALDPAAFLTRNPGLVGSNIILRAAVFRAVGGFDETLPAANDMDFGIRLSLHGGLRYAPLHAALVRHHRHRGPRLGMHRGDAMRAGIRRFFALHGARMSAAQRDEFARRMRRLWGIDEHGRDREP